MAEKGIHGIAAATIDELKNMVDASTIIGDPIETADGTMIIPVSRVQVGFASGGLDMANTKWEAQSNSVGRMGGGSGGGMIITPVAFLVVSPKDGVSLLQVADRNQTVDRALNLLPGLIKQISGLVEKDNKEPEGEDTAIIEAVDAPTEL